MINIKSSITTLCILSYIFVAMEAIPINQESCSALLLAAGKSERMGLPKFTLQFDKNTTFLEKIITQYQQFGCSKIVIVINKEGEKILEEKFPNLLKDCQIIVNPLENSSRFYSLQLGLKKIGSDCPIFIHNIDNPYANPNVLGPLFLKQHTADIIAPTYKGKGGHPILISKRVSKKIRACKTTDYILSDFLKQFSKKTVNSKDSRILTNINTKEAYDIFISRKIIN